MANNAKSMSTELQNDFKCNQNAFQKLKTTISLKSIIPGKKFIQPALKKQNSARF